MSVFKMMALLVVLLAVCCTLSVAAPQPREGEEEEQEGDQPAFPFNGEMDEGLEIIESLHRNQRSIDCNTAGIYGEYYGSYYSRGYYGSGHYYYDRSYDTPINCPCRDSIKKIYLHYTSGRIHQIQTTAVTADGDEVEYSAHGRSVGTAALIELAEGEQMIGVSGYYSAANICGLTFLSITDEGNIRVHGPYGDGYYRSCEVSFSVFGKISGFYVVYDTRIRGIRFYYEGEGLAQTHYR